MGGRSAILASEENFIVKNLSDTICVPAGVEMVWAMLTPKNVTSQSTIKKIVVGAIYSKPRSKKKTALIDHISETYHLMCSKFGSSVHFILLGDTNDLKLDQIVNISPYQAQSR